MMIVKSRKSRDVTNEHSDQSQTLFDLSSNVAAHA